MNDNWTDDLRAETIYVDRAKVSKTNSVPRCAPNGIPSPLRPYEAPASGVLGPWVRSRDVRCCWSPASYSSAAPTRTRHRQLCQTPTSPPARTRSRRHQQPVRSSPRQQSPMSTSPTRWRSHSMRGSTPTSDTQLPATFTAIDKNALPAGWSLFDETAAVYQFPSSGTELWYSYQAVVTTDDGTEFELYLDRGDHVDRCSTLGVEEVDISKRPIDATTAEAVLCLRRDDGFTVAVVPVGTADDEPMVGISGRSTSADHRSRRTSPPRSDRVHGHRRTSRGHLRRHAVRRTVGDYRRPRRLAQHVHLCRREPIQRVQQRRPQPTRHRCRRQRVQHPRRRARLRGPRVRICPTASSRPSSSKHPTATPPGCRCSRETTRPSTSFRSPTRSTFPESLSSTTTTPSSQSPMPRRSRGDSAAASTSC